MGEVFTVRMLLFVTSFTFLTTTPPPPSLSLSSAVFQAFALPSAGALPFLQSAICDFGGQPVTNYTDMPVYHNAL